MTECTTTISFADSEAREGRRTSGLWTNTSHKTKNFIW